MADPARRAGAPVQPVLDALGVHIAADAYVDTLTVFERVTVELVKAIVAGCRLIILREIGAMLSDPELMRLHAILRKYAREEILHLLRSKRRIRRSKTEKPAGSGGTRRFFLFEMDAAVTFL